MNGGRGLNAAVAVYRANRVARAVVPRAVSARPPSGERPCRPRPLPAGLRYGCLFGGKEEIGVHEHCNVFLAILAALQPNQ